MEAPSHLKKIFEHIDNHQKDYIKVLREAVAIKSVSAWPETRNEIVKMVEWTQKKLEGLGTKCSLHDVGIQTLPDGKKIPLPPVLFGQLGNDPKKKTVCVYGHLDVQPALKEDGWDTEPFVLTEKNGKLYGRGSTDDKGPVIGWIHALEAYQKLNLDIPINIKFVFEGMEESGSEGLDDLLVKEKDKFLSGTDFVCISDNYWLGKKKPCLTYGLRGICYFCVEVEGVQMDLHSGVFGGTVHESMADLMYLMNTLIDVNGKILIPGIMDQVAKVTPEEEKLYDSIDFDVEDYRNDIGAPKLINNKDKMKTLMARWRFPSLSLHGIQGAFSEPGAKTVIPKKVIGKFSIRIVPHQTPEFVTKCVVDYLNDQWKKRGSPNKMNAFLMHSGQHWLSDPNHPHYMAGRKAVAMVYGVEPDMTREGCSIPITITFQAYMFHGGRCWMSDTKHGNYQAGRNATKMVYGVEPDMTREGGSIPVTLTLQVIEVEGSAPAWMADPFHPNFEAGRRATQMVYNIDPDMTREGGSIPITITLQEVTGKNVMLLPMGASDDGAHSQNEKIDIRNYIQGTKLLAAYVNEISKV